MLLLTWVEIDGSKPWMSLRGGHNFKYVDAETTFVPFANWTHKAETLRSFRPAFWLFHFSPGSNVQRGNDRMGNGKARCLLLGRHDQGIPGNPPT